MPSVQWFLWVIPRVMWHFNATTTTTTTQLSPLIWSSSFLQVMVQEGLSPQVLKKLGHTRMPFDYLVYMVASVPWFCFLPTGIAFVFWWFVNLRFVCCFCLKLQFGRIDLDSHIVDCFFIWFIYDPYVFYFVPTFILTWRMTANWPILFVSFSPTREERAVKARSQKGTG